MHIKCICHRGHREYSKRIADRHFRSVGQIGHTSHLKNIYKKLNVHSRHTLVAKAYQEHLIGEP